MTQAFETYLTTIFGMQACDHVHFDAIVQGMKPRFVQEYLAVVRDRVRSVCAALLRERHAARRAKPVQRGAA